MRKWLFAMLPLIFILAAGHASAVRQREEKQKKLEAATVAFVQPGQLQTERDYNLQGEQSSPVRLQGRYGRRGTRWFSFDIPVDAGHPMMLIVTYGNEPPAKRSFDVLVNGRKVGDLVQERRAPGQEIRFFDVEYALSQDLIKGKQRVTVRFEATNGNEISPVFGIRMVRADAAR